MGISEQFPELVNQHTSPSFVPVEYVTESIKMFTFSEN
jgi:hypothetical protein